MIQDFVEQKKRAKKNVAANLSDDEHAVFHAVLKWRVENGFSRDSADLLRQMLHFVINREYAQRYDFLLPDADTIQSLINENTAAGRYVATERGKELINNITDGQHNGTGTSQG